MPSQELAGSHSISQNLRPNECTTTSRGVDAEGVLSPGRASLQGRAGGGSQAGLSAARTTREGDCDRRKRSGESRTVWLLWGLLGNCYSSHVLPKGGLCLTVCVKHGKLKLMKTITIRDLRQR